MQAQTKLRSNLNFFLLGWLILPVILSILFIRSIASNEVFAQNLLAGDNEAIELPKNKVPEYPQIDANTNGAVTIWFNNGWHSQYKYGLYLLEAKGMRGTMSAVTSYSIYSEYVDWDELKVLQNKGWEIVSQTRSYPCDVENLTTEQLQTEVYSSKRDFMKHGIIAEHFAAPCGVVNAPLTATVRSYYSSQKIGEEGVNYLPINNPYLLKSKTITNKTDLQDLTALLDEARLKHTWLILTINQINNDGSDQNITPEKFNKVVEEIEKSLVPTVVPSQMINERNVQGDPSIW